MDESERAYVLAAQRGDAVAFDRLARLHEEQILRVLHGILGDRDDTYDAYQETLVRAFLRLDSFRMDSSFSTWLTRIAINQALNARKKIRRTQTNTMELDDQQHPSVELGVAPVEQEDLRRAIDAAVEGLSDRERAVFVLRHQHHYRLREIAKMLGCAEGTVKNYLFRAIRKMRNALETEYRELESA